LLLGPNRRSHQNEEKDKPMEDFFLFEDSHAFL
jgi:hypothetical protein